MSFINQGTEGGRNATDFRLWLEAGRLWHAGLQRFPAAMAHMTNEQVANIYEVQPQLGGDNNTATVQAAALKAEVNSVKGHYDNAAQYKASSDQLLAMTG
jgi:hypothetical protein